MTTLQEAEVEVDIDDLNQETLWRLNALVNDLSVGRVPDAGGANLLERADDAGALNHVVRTLFSLFPEQ
jgi:hypothetical protein